jgi:hypothetical protein
VRFFVDESLSPALARHLNELGFARLADELARITDKANSGQLHHSLTVCESCRPPGG